MSAYHKQQKQKTSKLKLNTLLWIDFLLGVTTGIAGILFFRHIGFFFRIPPRVFLIISLVTFLYALLALFLAKRNTVAIKPTKTLIVANWLWSLVSVVLTCVYFSDASVVGKLYLILQIFIVGGLAYLEDRALKHFQKAHG